MRPDALLPTLDEVPGMVDTRAIMAALRDRHQGEWAFFAELRIGTGYGKDAEQRLDAWAMNLWPSSSFRRVTYEIKISRGDFLRELREPLKRRAGLLVSNEFYFAAPKGLITVDSLPPECGLVEVDGAHTARVVRSAPWRDTSPASWRFVASLVRRVQALEANGVPLA